MNVKLKQFLAGLLLLTSYQAFAADMGSLLKTESLLAEPFRDAKVLSSLNKGQSIEIIGKQGAWYQVRLGKTQGWVKMLSVRKGGSSSSTASTVSGIAGIASGRTGTGKVVSTTGIRGLNEEELKAAQFNEAELKKLDTWVVSREAARSFAQQGNLKVQDVKNLKE